MFRKIDDWLIDNVFQRISDRLSFICSCYALAVYSLLAAGLLVGGSFVVARDWWGIGLCGPLLFLETLRARELDQQSHRDALPIERIAKLFTRTFLLATAISVTPAFVDNVLIGRWLKVVLFPGFCAIVLAYYFMACRPRPPRQKRSTAWSPGWQRTESQHG